MGLSIGDGFRFGCGLMIAVLVFQLVLAALSAMVMLVLMVLGMMPLLFMPQTLVPLLPLA